MSLYQEIHDNAPKKGIKERPMSLPSKAVSAPGKVLLAGGYLVLDPKHTGLVFALDARIHVHIESLSTTEGVSLQEISVRSPQFRHANWTYGYHTTDEEGGVQVVQLRAGANSSLHRNPFIETALAYALTYALTSLPTGTTIEPSCITILADDGYYSQESNQQRVGEKSGRGRFTIFNTPLEEAHKTGLGSSAALVTAFTAAILIHYLPKDSFSILTAYGKSRLHNLAQAAHNAAQGKVGSGFDVASAVYGSCMYRRSLRSSNEELGDVGSPKFAEKLKEAVNGIWPFEMHDSQRRLRSPDAQITRSSVNMPQGIRLVMCDVDCGSKTPGMVKKVLDWRDKNREDANDIWNRLQTANDHFAAELVRLAEGSVSDYSTLRQLILDIRALIREMSTMSEVPIEPEAQTELLDACSEVPGILGGIVPGAGGYDAIALLIEDKDDVLEALNRFLACWEGKKQEDSAGSIGRIRLLNVREDKNGIRLEDPEQYSLWTRC